jgi:Pyruvate/2-oxoacid:ferredoxin oxidoreductase delta subunit
MAGDLDDHEVNAEELVGLVFPTHGFIAPWTVFRFVLQLPRGRGRHAIVMPTRAGLRLGRVFTPGMEGTGAFFIALILLIKGFSVRAASGIDMPSNWISVHPGLGSRSVERISERLRMRIARIMARVLEGRRYFSAGAFMQLLLGLLLLPISLGYLLIGRFSLAKLFYANADCTNCGLCALNCAHDGVRMIGEKEPSPFWNVHCESCMRCMGNCPQEAIEASWPLGVLFYFVTSVPVASYLLNLAVQALSAPQWVHNRVVWWTVQYMFFLLSIVISYFLFILLARVTAINRLLTFFTPTHYYRRYHEPGTNLKSIQPANKKQHVR